MSDLIYKIQIKSRDIELNGYALRAYRENHRETILNAKIFHSPHALLKIEREIESIKLNAQNSLPAPSSLISKLKGRYDVALFMASIVAATSHAKLLLPEFNQQFSRNKQTSLGQRGDAAISLMYTKIVKPKSLSLAGPVLVDDVLTTGATLLRMAKHMHWDHAYFICYAFAEKISKTKVD